MKPQDKPNIVLVVLDTVRADHVSCYGYKRQTTPFIDSLASKGMLFEQAISPSSWSLPVHVSMFTGLYASKHRFWQLGDSAKHNLPLTITQLLSNIGYQTVGISANPWLTEAKLDQQFDYFYENYKSAQVSGKVFKQFTNKFWKRLKTPINRMMFYGDKGASWINSEAKRWLHEIPSQTRPFFMFINFMDAHYPYVPPRPFHKTYSKYPFKTLVTMYKTFTQLTNYLNVAGSIPLQDINDFIDLYDGEISYLDTQVKHLVNTLIDATDFKNTVLIITSDHGDNFGEHLLNGRQLMLHQFSVHETLIRVPLIIFAPTYLGKERIEFPVSLIDIAPTIAELVGVSPFLSEYSSLLSPDANRIIKSEYKTPLSTLERLQRYANGMNSSADIAPFDLNLKAVRNRHYKLIVSNPNEKSLYDIVADPLEQNPLDRRKLSPEIMHEYKLLHNVYKNWVEEENKGDDSKAVDKFNELDSSLISERLKALGYL